MYPRHRVLSWSPVSGSAHRMASSFLRMRPLALGARGSPAADRLPALQRSGSLAGALPQAPAPVDCSTTWFPGKRFSNWRRGRRLPEDRFTNAAPSTDQSARSTRPHRKHANSIVTLKAWQLCVRGYPAPRDNKRAAADVSAGSPPAWQLAWVHWLVGQLM